MKSQNQALLEYLQAGNTITSKDAYEKLGITQLATRIFELKEDGHNIVADKWKEVPIRYGDGTTKVKVYRLISGGQQSMFGRKHRDGVGL